MSNRNELTAFCGSRDCAGYHNYRMVVKDVPRGTDKCPDCQHQLRWDRSRVKMRHFANTKTKKKDDTVMGAWA